MQIFPFVTYTFPMTHKKRIVAEKKEGPVNKTMKVSDVDSSSVTLY